MNIFNNNQPKKKDDEENGYFLMEFESLIVLLEFAADVAQIVEKRLPRFVDGRVVRRRRRRVEANHIDGLHEAFLGRGIVAVLIGHGAQLVQHERVVGRQRMGLIEKTVGQTDVVHQSVLQADVQHW